MNRKTAIYATPLVVALTIVMSGCMSAQERVGWVPADQNVGESSTATALTGRAPYESPKLDAETDATIAAQNLTYIDGNGNERSLDHLFKDYTLLLFTSADQDDREEQVRQMEQIVASQWNAWYVKVAGVDVHTSPGGCDDPEDCRLVADRYNLSSICDEAGVVREAYQVGDDETDLLLLHSDGTVLASASQGGIDAIQARLTEEVRYLDSSRAIFEDIP